MTATRRIRGLMFAVLVAAACLLCAASARADFGIEGFDVEFLDGPNAVTQAGSHPAEMTTTIDLNKFSEETPFGPLWMPDESQMRNITVDLPPGFVGNPTAVGTCTDDELMSIKDSNEGSCPLDSQVGIVQLKMDNSLLQANLFLPVFNMKAPEDSPAVFAFKFTYFPVHFRARVRSGSDHGISVDVSNINQALPLYGSKLTLWSVPADKIHNPYRRGCMNPNTGEPFTYTNEWGETVPRECPSGAPRKAFLSLPTTCTAAPSTDLAVTAWNGASDSAVSTLHEAGNPAAPTPLTGCDELPFDPSVKTAPDEPTAGSPSGFAVDISMPAGTGGAEPAQSHLKRVEVTLPEGVTVSPSSAAGLGACPDAQANLGTDDPAQCPRSAKVGSVSIDTPVLDDPLEGGIYLLQPQPGNLFRLLLTAEGSGVALKLRGDAHPDPVTGQLRAVFDDNPQLPFSNVRVQFKAGPRAPLTNPTKCGTYTTKAVLTAWNGQTVSSSSSFTVGAGQGGACSQGPINPGFEAGTANPVAGKYSPFTLRVTRSDGQLNVAALGVTLPKGLLAKLAGVPLCPDAQAATGACPADSRVGSATVGAGSGSNPVYLPEAGKAPTAVYLAGPYKGAPYSLVAVVPAQAGPFDLGTVAVRNTIDINPVTAQASVQSDPLPQILEGIPVTYRDIRVDIDRSEFTVNPTSCEPMQVGGTIAAAGGAAATVSDRFQVAGCERLGFSPKLKMSLYGAPPRRGGFPALKATLTAPKGQANIGKASVLLPGTELLEQNHIRTICTRDQWASDTCPKAAIYGKAKAWTPLLDKPLEGPVYLRANGGARELPDLVADLRGQIEIELAGYIDTVKRNGVPRMRTRFVNVPDAAVTKFVLQMQGGRKGLLANNTNLCKAKPRAGVQFDGQNGKVHDINPLVAVSGCGKKGK